jgi:hypothetical protein
MGGLYILIVPLIGLAGIIVVISRYLLYRKKYKTKNHIKNLKRIDHE